MEPRGLTMEQWLPTALGPRITWELLKYDVWVTSSETSDWSGLQSEHQDRQNSQVILMVQS